FDIDLGDYVLIDSTAIHDTTVIDRGAKYETAYRLMAGDGFGDELVLGYASLPARGPIALGRFEARPSAGAVTFSWSTTPRAGEGGLMGYRIYRLASGASPPGSRIGPDVITDTVFTYPETSRGASYTLEGVYDLGDEAELGTTSLPPPAEVELLSFT